MHVQCMQVHVFTHAIFAIANSHVYIAILHDSIIEENGHFTAFEIGPRGIESRSSSSSINCRL